MAILKIARMGHPVLKLRAEPVADPKSQEIQDLVRDMVETLQDIGGIGLAAPQVHVSRRVVIFFVPGSRRGGEGDPAEEELMARHGVVRTDDPAAVLAGREVFVHLDVDILDPTVMPGQLYPAPGGLDTTQLHDLLADVAARARIVGAEITCFSTPELSDALAHAAAPLLESPAS